MRQMEQTECMLADEYRDERDELIQRQDKLVKALEAIRAKGRVCSGYETCDHPARKDSYESWAEADKALREIGRV